MRVILVMLLSLALTACTAMMVGGGASGSYPANEAERPAGVVSTDAAITNRIKSRYAADPVIRGFSIGVGTYEGTVTLYGAVGSILARNRAVSLARQTDGVKAVNDQIVIEDRSE